ncbi:MAG: hypothetical protein PQ612_06175 [Rickettsiales bacterium]|nr:hypothetical protein [Pseudomonadota bacterium]MDA0966558.1 hypothetical protein [Pseudomonadota bacterium]MDG4543587.1 hypothetical protein [Rickettsiales bacterium]MDG4545734.1 hypothetical protein [Rickettsiales bacterium]MDG4547493.1 hypothetical protein [Rickettsiales bacterium]
MLNITKAFIAIGTLGTLLFLTKHKEENKITDETVDTVIDEPDSLIIENEAQTDNKDKSTVDQESIRKVMSEMGKRSAEKRRTNKSS